MPPNQARRGATWAGWRSPSLFSASPISHLPMAACDENHRHHHRSEEHTSELQSRQYLVCRLLLEKNHRSRELALMVWQQHHGAPPLGHVDSRRLVELLFFFFDRGEPGQIPPSPPYQLPKR